jgi:hypothetical protein
MFGQILQKFAEKSPATVMVRALLEQLLNPEKLDQWFEVTRQTQYTRDILFSSLVGLMLQIVCKTQASVHAAYRHANIAASIIAVYGKLQGVELTTSQALVRYIAREAQVLIETMNGARAPVVAWVSAQVFGWQLPRGQRASPEATARDGRWTLARQVAGGVRSATEYRQ